MFSKSLFLSLDPFIPFVHYMVSLNSFRDDILREEVWLGGKGFDLSSIEALLLGAVESI